MTKREKRIKFWNKFINIYLKIKLQLRIFMGRFPDIYHGYDIIRKKGYTNSKTISLFNFNIMTSGNWGSARPDMDNVFLKECVNISDNYINIITKPKKATGKDYYGNTVSRECSSGLVTSKNTFESKGIYVATITIDPKARESWDAWWFLLDRSKYKEIDMYERFFKYGKHSNKFTTSVHKGDSSIVNRNMYNSAVKIPKKITTINIAIEFLPNKDQMKVYYNGILVFKGLQWMTHTPMTMIINSGILKDQLCYARYNLNKNWYLLQVSNIIHFTK